MGHLFIIPSLQSRASQDLGHPNSLDCVQTYMRALHLNISTCLQKMFLRGPMFMVVGVIFTISLSTVYPQTEARAGAIYRGRKLCSLYSPFYTIQSYFVTSEKSKLLVASSIIFVHLPKDPHGFFRNSDNIDKNSIFKFHRKNFAYIS